jgi:hypothetical protein
VLVLVVVLGRSEKPFEDEDDSHAGKNFDDADLALDSLAFRA